MLWFHLFNFKLPLYSLHSSFSFSIIWWSSPSAWLYLSLNLFIIIAPVDYFSAYICLLLMLFMRLFLSNVSSVIATFAAQSLRSFHSVSFPSKSVCLGPRFTLRSSLDLIISPC